MYIVYSKITFVCIYSSSIVTYFAYINGVLQLVQQAFCFHVKDAGLFIVIQKIQLGVKISLNKHITSLSRVANKSVCLCRISLYLFFPYRKETRKIVHHLKEEAQR